MKADTENVKTIERACDRIEKVLAEISWEVGPSVQHNVNEIRAMCCEVRAQILRGREV